MDRRNPVVMKTYGKQKRTLYPWISPDTRKKAFDSTISSESDVSVFMPSKRARKISVSNRRELRPAKKKVIYLKDDSDENSYISSPFVRPTQQNKPARSVRTSNRTSKPPPTPAGLLGQKAQQVSNTSKSEEDSTSTQHRMVTDQMKRNRDVDLPPLGHFITQRRRAVASKPKLPEAVVVLDSSDDFVTRRGATGVRTRHMVSSAEKYVNDAGTASSPTNSVLRELILNESADHSLKPCPRKPLFCSTPSVPPLGKQPRRKLPINHQSSNSLSISVSHIDLFSTSQEDLESPKQHLSPPYLTPLSSEEREKHQSTLGEPQKESSGSERDNSHNNATETQHCAVQLQRLDKLTLASFKSQTTNSPLDHSSSVHSQQTPEHPLSVEGSQTIHHSNSVGPSFQLVLSVNSNETNSYSQSVSDICDSADNASLVSDDQITDHTDTQQVSNSRSDQTQSIDPGTEERAAALILALKEKCLTEKVTVKVKRATRSQWKGTQQLENTTHKSPAEVSNSANDGQSVRTWVGDDHKSEAVDTANTDHRNRSKNVGKRKSGSTTSEDKIPSDNKNISRDPHGILHKKKKPRVASNEKRRRSVSRDRFGTSRKAIVSGLSVSRWKNKGNTSAHMSQSQAAQRGGSKAVDWNINELLSTQHKQPTGTSVVFSTPVRATQLNLSSLLADLTPDTHTWSRLKAAVSVHRKTKVFLTPKTLHPPMPGSPGGMGLADVSQDLFGSPLQTPLSKLYQSQLLRSASVDPDLSDEEKVYAECGQQGPLPWECILPQQCEKIGEGTFGEVFSTTNASGDLVALKIIPVEGSEKVNGENQKTFGEILHEIIISKELSSLKEKQQNQTHGFIGLIDLHCVRGCYPTAFLDAWDAFDQQKGSENDRPDMFEKTQLFLILEFEFGGSDLESSNGTLSSVIVAKSILHQVTAALAVAEQELHFEHRDLHWGNVLVKPTKEKKGSFLLNGATHSLKTKGVVVRIIDYSLSRLEIDGLTVSCDISEDEELFMGQGDYQFDIYRLMREENRNNWSKYQPHSNVLWLHYLASKLLSMKYRMKGGRGPKDAWKELRQFHESLIQYRSATEVLNCPMFQ